MTRTRRGAGGDDVGGSDGHGNGKGNEDLPPPPHPTPAEMMAQLMETQHSMAEVLRGLAQNVGQGCGRDQHQGPEPNQFSTSRTSLTPSLLFLRKWNSH